MTNDFVSYKAGFSVRQFRNHYRDHLHFLILPYTILLEILNLKVQMLFINCYESEKKYRRSNNGSEGYNMHLNQALKVHYLHIPMYRKYIFALKGTVQH